MQRHGSGTFLLLRGGKVDEIVRLFANVCRGACETVAIRFGFHLLLFWQSCLRQCCVFLEKVLLGDVQRVFLCQRLL